jgi:hypothetical protein
MKIFSSKHIVGLLASVVLTACGGGGGGGDAPAPAASPVSATPSPAPAPAPAPATTPAPAPVATAPAAPALKYPIPVNLWAPQASAVPATTGNYIYLHSDVGDTIGDGRTYTYAETNAILTLSASALGLDVAVKGGQNWNGHVQLPGAAGNLQAGYFADLTRAPSADPAIGGIEWTVPGRSCNTIKGWVVIDKVELNAGALSALDLRFEQHCEGSTAALHGQVHWTQANAALAASSGAALTPAGAWQPPAGTTPSAGNYLYLDSRYGDYIGNGRSYLYTPADAIFTVSPVGNRLGVRIGGDQYWDGDFQAPQSQSQLTVGYYGDLKRYPFHDAVVGGLSWSGEGRGCNMLNGWFAVDKVTYSGSTLTEIDLRFEQFCDNNQTPLRGKLHWSAADTTRPPGPAPVPANLWSPDASMLPAAGNYVYLASDQGDFIGSGRTEVLTANNSTLNVTTNLTAALHIAAGPWTGDFVGMNTLSQLQPGYYGNLQRYPFHNAVKGGMSWWGSGRGCNKLTGWFVVDRVAYLLGELTAIDLRFEQHCEGLAPAQRGVIHWSK